MLEVSDKAVSHLVDVGKQEGTKTAIRVAVMGSGTSCGLGLIRDEIKETDITTTKGDHTIVIDAKLMEYCHKISIDFTEGEPDRCDSRSKRGFLLSAENPLNF